MDTDILIDAMCQPRRLTACPITELPDSLTVGGSLLLCGTQITKLPNNLIVGGSLDLSDTPLTELPEGLVIGGYLDLSGTQIKALPKDLAIGGRVVIKDNPGITPWQARKIPRLKNGDRGDGSYIYADQTLTLVKEVQHTDDGYTLYVGKIPGKIVVSDGEYYAHCENFIEGVVDIALRRAKDRGVKRYLDIDRNTPIPLEDAKIMYKIITGLEWYSAADRFAKRLMDENGLKDAYTINEMLATTEGLYKGKAFTKFFA